MFRYWSNSRWGAATTSLSTPAWSADGEWDAKISLRPAAERQIKNSNFGLRNFHYGYTLNIGYNHFISATYYRSRSSKTARPRVQQINVRLSFIL